MGRWIAVMVTHVGATGLHLRGCLPLSAVVVSKEFMYRDGVAVSGRVFVAPGVISYS